MYCYNCGKFFHPNDAVRKHDPETGTVFCCPHCGVDDIGETTECSVCGKECVEGETREGICLSCLWDAITYDVALAYMRDSETLARFLIEDVHGAKLTCTSPSLNMFCENEFRRMVANDKLMEHTSGKAAFLEQCRLFILPYYPNGDFGIDGGDFAEWLHDYRKEALS